MENKYLRILVIGRPNVGKTSIVNCLTGSNLKVGNFAGVTTNMSEIMLKYDDKIMGIIDSPGLYSINQISGKDEEIVVDFLKKSEGFDVILNILDSMKIESDIILTKEILQITNKPVILCFNSYDVAERSGVSINIALLEEKLGLHVIKTDSCSILKCCDPKLIAKIANPIPRNLAKLDNFDEKISACVTKKIVRKKIDFTKILDKIFLNRILALPIFALIMLSIFYVTFELSEPIKSVLAFIFSFIAKFVDFVITNREIASMINDGILQGVLSIIQFLPSIVILFTCINLLERSGYMSRISFIMDSFMKLFGLSGKAVIPFISGFGCSIPAYISARILPSKIERISAMFAIGFMTCSAKFTFFIMIVGLIFSKADAPFVMLGIYFLSAIVGLFVSAFVSFVLTRNLPKKLIPVSPLIEMPRYKFPNLKQVLKTVKIDALSFLKKAGGFIVVCSFAVWVLSNYPVKSGFYKQEKAAIEANDEIKIAELNKERLENSVLATFGRTLDPVFSYLGFDWRTNVVILSGLLGKEVGISTMGILYGIDIENGGVLRIDKYISRASSIALIVFFMFYLPCLSATVVFKKEAEYKYATSFLVISTSLIAYFFALAAYTLFA